MLTELACLLGVLTLGLLSPGPDFFLIVRNSLGGDRARAWGTVAGIALGIAAQVLAISLGFAAAPPAAMRVVQLAGAAFLAWMGIRALWPARKTGDHAASDTPSPASARTGFAEGLLCNLTNPKAFIFFVSLFAQLVHADSPLLWRIAVPAAVVVHGAVAWSLVVCAVQAPPVARQLTRAQHWLPRAFGAALLIFAAALAWKTLRA